MLTNDIYYSKNSVHIHADTAINDGQHIFRDDITD